MAIVGYNPVETPEFYDHLIIAGVETPGVVKIDGASRPYKWDVKEGKGTSGGTTTFQGAGVPKVKVTLTMWLPEHFAAWDDLRTALQASLSKAVTALDVLYPDLSELDIFSCVVEDIGQVKRVKQGDTLSTVDFSLIEYHPPKKAGGNPSGSKNGGWVGGASGKGAQSQGNAQTENEKQIAALLAKAKEP